ncbi:MAG: hypothetical protein WC087_03945 [Candidatus Paceibacterota bacterium]
MNIIEKLKSLNLPSNQYVVISSGILDVLGIRKANDIDLSITKELHEQLRKTGEWEEDVRYGKVFLLKEDIEINPDVSWEDYKTTTKELIETALVVDGINFMNLEEVIKFKKALGREKDFKDIELIEEYLKSN